VNFDFQGGNDTGLVTITVSTNQNAILTDVMDEKQALAMFEAMAATLRALVAKEKAPHTPSPDKAQTSEIRRA
jgi:hypothetical protein